MQARNQAPFMKEVGIDIYGNGTQAMGDLLTGEESFDHVITVCDEANAERCPILPGSGLSSPLGVSGAGK